MNYDRQKIQLLENQTCDSVVNIHMTKEIFNVIFFLYLKQIFIISSSTIVILNISNINKAHIKIKLNIN